MMLDLTHNKRQLSAPDTVKLNITTAGGDLSLIEGRYSESFVEELARQLTAKLSSALGISGLAESTIEIDMVFSPESFMEHTSDGVTYRRLMMYAKGCAPRDLWVKWRGIGGEPLSCASDVTPDSIEFSLGEDVPHKVREREYRYLVHGNSDKYRTAMGKKNITEWRELVKRALKRGELTRTAGETEVSQHSEEVADKLADLLERFNINLPKETSGVSETADDIAELAKAKLAGRGIGEEPSAPIVEEAPVTVPFFPEEEISEESEEEFLGDFIGSLEISAPAEPAPSFEEEYEKEPYAEQKVSVPVSGPDIPVFTPAESEYTNTIPTAKEEPIPVCVASSDSDILRARLNEEVIARSEAEEKLAAVTAERDAIKADLEYAKETVASLKDTYEKLIAELSAERDSLKSELELEASARQREKMLFAEAARQQKEESDRLIREREEELQRRAAEDARLAAEQAREAELLREEELRRTEVERIERDIRSRDEDKRTALERAQELSRAMEREAMLKMQSIGLADKRTAAPVSAPVTESAEEIAEDTEARPAPIGPENHPYTSIKAKLIFRHNVDPNVKSRLYEIISRALEYYKKEHVYIKLKASLPEPASVMLDFEQFPEGEDELLRGIVKLIGNSDLGVMKIIVE